MDANGARSATHSPKGPVPPVQLVSANAAQNQCSLTNPFKPMPTKKSNSTSSHPAERRAFLTVLAVVPNAREVGLAVLDLGGLVHHAVIGIRKHRTPEGQEVLSDNY